MWWQHPHNMEVGDDSDPRWDLWQVCWAWILVCEPGRESPPIKEKEMDLKTHGQGQKLLQKESSPFKREFTAVARCWGGGT